MSVSVEGAVAFPVFVMAKDSGEVMRFDSPEHMEYLEAVDVEDDEYKAWDATGRVLLLTASHISRLSSGNIVVSSTEVTEDSGKFNKLIQIAKKVS